MISFTGNRRYLDPLVIHAENVIYATYGDTVRVSEKNKDLLKFGSILSTVGTTEQTVAEFQGSTLRETFATTNSIDYIICTDATPYTATLNVEGQTISGSDLTFVSQTKALNGQTAVALDTPLARVTRAWISGSTALATPATDKIYVYDSTVATGTTAGVPDVAAATKLIVNGVEYQSEKGSTSLSSQDYWIVTGFYAGILKTSGVTTEATIRLRHRVLGNILRTQAPKLFLSSEGTLESFVPFNPYYIIPKNSDIELTVVAGAAGTQLTAGISGYLAKVV